MRTLDECKQEIFLRSERRIRRRKRILGGVVAGCIPVLLVTAVLLLPPMERKTGSALPEDAVLSAGGGITVSDPALAARLEGFFMKSESAPESATGAPEATNPPKENYGTPTPLQITCIASDGTVIRYTLSGNTLTNLNTGETAILTAEERALLIGATQ